MPFRHHRKTVVVSSVGVDSFEEVLVVLIAGQEAEVNPETGLLISLYFLEVPFIEGNDVNILALVHREPVLDKTRQVGEVENVIIV